MDIPDNVKSLLENPNNVKIVTTVDKDGNPHSVPVNSVTVMDDGNIAFMELLDTSITQKNLLNCYWFKKDVPVLVIGDWAKGEAFQITCSAYKFLTEGPVWDKFLDIIWSEIPEADPSGVWLLTPKEIRNQNYFARRKGEEERRADWTTWLTLKGARK